MRHAFILSDIMPVAARALVACNPALTTSEAVAVRI